MQLLVDKKNSASHFVIEPMPIVLTSSVVSKFFLNTIFDKQKSLTLLCV